jgi:murein L,D-transpeptidase YafK
MSGADGWRIVVRKRARTLLLECDGRPGRTFRVQIGRNVEADKAVEGDEATPLGEFYVCAKNPRSRYFLSLCLSYPNLEHAARGLAAGLISPAEHAAIADAIRRQVMPPQHTRLGGEIYLHGHGARAPAQPAKDWTRGCIALEDADMQELYERASLGTPVLITP